jgi:hypothetical protein
MLIDAYNLLPPAQRELHLKELLKTYLQYKHHRSYDPELSSGMRAKREKIKIRLPLGQIQEDFLRLFDEVSKEKWKLAIRTSFDVNAQMLKAQRHIQDPLQLKQRMNQILRAYLQNKDQKYEQLRRTYSPREKLDRVISQLPTRELKAYVEAFIGHWYEFFDFYENDGYIGLRSSLPSLRGWQEGMTPRPVNPSVHGLSSPAEAARRIETLFLQEQLSEEDKSNGVQQVINNYLKHRMAVNSLLYLSIGDLLTSCVTFLQELQQKLPGPLKKRIKIYFDILNDEQNFIRADRIRQRGVTWHSGGFYHLDVNSSKIFCSERLRRLTFENSGTDSNP